MQNNIYNIALEVANHIMKQLNVERYIITQIKSSKDFLNQAKKCQVKWNRLSTEAQQMFPLAMTLKTNADETAMRKHLFGNVATGPNMAGRLFTRIQMSILHALILDIVSSVSKYGTDPDFQKNPVGNNRPKKWLKIEEEYRSEHQVAYDTIVQQLEEAKYKPSHKKQSSNLCLIFHPPCARVPTKDSVSNKEHNVNIKYHVHDDINDYLTEHLTGEVKEYHVTKQKNRLLREYLT